MSCAASRNMLQLHCCCRCHLWMMRERPSSSLTRSMAQKQRTARVVDGVLQLLRWSQSILPFAGLRHEKDSTLVSSVCPYSDRQSCITHPWPWKSPLEGKFFRGEANPGDLVLGAHELLWKKQHSSNHFMNFMYFSDFRLQIGLSFKLRQECLLAPPTRSIPAQQNVHQSHNCVNLDAGWTPETCSTSRDIENRRSPDKYPHCRYLRSEATCLAGGKGGPEVIPNILMISCFVSEELANVQRIFGWFATFERFSWLWRRGCRQIQPWRQHWMQFLVCIHLVILHQVAVYNPCYMSGLADYICFHIISYP